MGKHLKINKLQNFSCQDKQEEKTSDLINAFMF